MQVLDGSGAIFRIGAEQLSPIAVEIPAFSRAEIAQIVLASQVADARAAVLRQIASMIVVIPFDLSAAPYINRTPQRCALIVPHQGTWYTIAFNGFCTREEISSLGHGSQMIRTLTFCASVYDAAQGKYTGISPGGPADPPGPWLPPGPDPRDPYIPPPFVPPTQAEVAGWWKLLETSGTTAYDSSGNGNHLAVTSPTWSNGLVANGTGGGIASGGVNYNIRAGPISYCAWFSPGMKTRVNPSYFVYPFPHNVMSADIPGSGGPGWGANVWNAPDSGAYLKADWSVYNADRPDLVSIGVMRHYCLTFGGGSGTIYVDGISIATGPLGDTSNTNIIRLNHHNNDSAYGNNRFACGTLRDARIYKSILTQSQILQIVAMGPAKS